MSTRTSVQYFPNSINFDTIVKQHFLEYLCRLASHIDSYIHSCIYNAFRLSSIDYLQHGSAHVGLLIMDKLYTGFEVLTTFASSVVIYFLWFPEVNIPPSFNNSITPSSVNNSPNSSVISIPSFPHAFPSFPLAHINSGIHQRRHPNIHTSIHDHAFSKCTQYTSTCYSSFTLNVAIARPAEYFMW